MISIDTLASKEMTEINLAVMKAWMKVIVLRLHSSVYSR